MGACSATQVKHMGTKKGQVRKTARRAYELPKGKAGAIFTTKGGRMRVRRSNEGIKKSVRLGHIFKGFF